MESFIDSDGADAEDISAADEQPVNEDEDERVDQS